MKNVKLNVKDCDCRHCLRFSRGTKGSSLDNWHPPPHSISITLPYLHQLTGIRISNISTRSTRHLNPTNNPTCLTIQAWGPSYVDLACLLPRPSHGCLSASYFQVWSLTQSFYIFLLYLDWKIGVGFIEIRLFSTAGKTLKAKKPQNSSLNAHKVCTFFYS